MYTYSISITYTHNIRHRLKVKHVSILIGYYKSNGVCIKVGQTYML